jgi:exo-1,4-beta-D-glucosaminidase
VKKACTPLHAIYRYGFNDVILANEDLKDAENLTVKIKVLDINSKELFSHMWTGKIKSNSSRLILKLEDIKGLTPVWFLDIRILDVTNKEVDNSFYWLSEKEDVLDYSASKKLPWAYYTPTKQFADFTLLDKLPKVKLQYDYGFTKDEKSGNISFKVKNPSQSVAFFIFLDVVDPASGKPVLPIYWNDNYVTLLPGEERTYSANYRLSDFSGIKPVIEVQGWNVDKETLK